MTGFLIRGARVAGGAPTDLLIRDGVIESVGDRLSAPGAEVITCGTVSANVTVKIDSSSSWVSTCCSPGGGDGAGEGAVLNV